MGGAPRSDNDDLFPNVGANKVLGTFLRVPRSYEIMYSATDRSGNEETGRYDNIPRDERLCHLCNCNRIEDETHFLLYCPSFSSIRDMFFPKLEPKILFLRLQSHESLLSHLMNSTDYFINIQLISFISTCFELRDKLISGIINPTDG